MGEEKKKSGLSASFVTGAVALVFLTVGYQVAVFLNRAALSRILEEREAAEFAVREPESSSGPESEYGPGHQNDSDRTVPDTRHSRGDMQKSGAGRNFGTGRSARGADSDAGTGRKRRQVESFRFNPNDISVEGLQRLGFSEAQARAIDNYRIKGGRFSRKSDFAKSFVVSDSIYRRLEPYIDIPLTDLNAADSAAFDALPGIGGYFASKIVEYRTALGGYSYKEQLMDIYRFDKDRFDALKDLVEVCPEHCRPYRLWSLPEDSLRIHPYIGPYSARGVVVYRENNPEDKWTVDGLEEAGILRRGMAEKLRRCRLSK